MKTALHDATSKQKNNRTGIGKALSSSSIWIVLAVLVLIMSLTVPSFFTVRNIFSVLKSITPVAIVAFGLTFVFLGGGFDLSQGATLIFSATLIISMNPATPHGFIGSALLILLIAGLIGSVNGFFIGVQRLNPFIVSLGTRFIIGGVIFLQASGMVVGASFQSRILEVIGLGRVFKILPIQTLIFIFIAITCWFVIKYIPYSRKIRIVGSSDIAGNFAGLSVNRIQMSTYIINGVFAGIAGVLLGCQVAHLAPVLVWKYDFDAITACAIGGISLTGGKGTILGTLSGVLLLGFISNSMILLGLPYHLQLTFKGAILLAAIIIDVRSKMRYD
jgi:ribose/xylose/arabinose/galactoside ABC-type transport system permease subunit